MKRVILLVLLTFLLVSCVQPTPIVQIVEVTRIIKETIQVTVPVVVTATPLPVTETPSPSPTSAFWKYSVNDAAKAIQDAGLEFVDPVSDPPQESGIRPYVENENLHFLIPSLCSDCGGRLFSFDNERDLNTLKKYYDGLKEASAMWFSWVYVKDNILLQINGDLPEDKAKLYEEVLNNLK